MSIWGFRRRPQRPHPPPREGPPHEPGGWAIGRATLARPPLGSLGVTPGLFPVVPPCSKQYMFIYASMCFVRTWSTRVFTHLSVSSAQITQYVHSVHVYSRICLFLQPRSHSTYIAHTCIHASVCFVSPDHTPSTLSHTPSTLSS